MPPECDKCGLYHGPDACDNAVERVSVEQTMNNHPYIVMGIKALEIYANKRH